MVWVSAFTITMRLSLAPYDRLARSPSHQTGQYQASCPMKGLRSWEDNSGRS